MTVLKKTTAQSMSVSPEEKVLIETLALGERMKPASFVREIFFKGMYEFLKDRKVHAVARNEEIYESMLQLIDSDEELTRMKNLVEYRLGLFEGNKRAPAGERNVHSFERTEAVSTTEFDVNKHDQKTGQNTNAPKGAAKQKRRA